MGGLKRLEVGVEEEVGSLRDGAGVLSERAGDGWSPGSGRFTSGDLNGFFRVAEAASTRLRLSGGFGEDMLLAARLTVYVELTAYKQAHFAS
jgi:hypothetical protein